MIEWREVEERKGLGYGWRSCIEYWRKLLCKAYPHLFTAIFCILNPGKNMQLCRFSHHACTAFCYILNPWLLACRRTSYCRLVTHMCMVICCILNLHRHTSYWPQAWLYMCVRPLVYTETWFWHADINHTVLNLYIRRHQSRYPSAHAHELEWHVYAYTRIQWHTNIVHVLLCCVPLYYWRARMLFTYRCSTTTDFQCRGQWTRTDTLLWCSCVTGILYTRYPLRIYV